MKAWLAPSSIVACSKKCCGSPPLFPAVHFTLTEVRVRWPAVQFLGGSGLPEEGTGGDQIGRGRDRERAERKASYGLKRDRERTQKRASDVRGDREAAGQKEVRWRKRRKRKGQNRSNGLVEEDRGRGRKETNREEGDEGGSEEIGSDGLAEGRRREWGNGAKGKGTRWVKG